MQQQGAEVQESTESQSSVASEGTPATTAPTALEADELKVVVQLKGRRAIIVVGAPGCDPVIHMAEAPSILESTRGNLWLEVENAITQARAQWEQAKKYPAYTAPAPPPRATTSRTQVATQPKVFKGKAKPQEEKVVQQGLPLL
ncbi:MAG: hypothetical protein Q7K03_07875 [Dehalococcoidia bacterium]|nr:hypothetical protein [Dehalococcoidia bacterium]